MKKINIFIWCSVHQIKDVMGYWLSIKKVKMDLMVWCKTNPAPKNNGLLTDVEYCLWFREKGLKVNGDYYNKSKFYVSAINRNDKKKYKHATIKPLEFVKNHILCATNENDLVIDFFVGSGTTAVACKELGRHYLGFEINPKYYQIALDRVNGISQLNRVNGVIQLNLFEEVKL